MFDWNWVARDVLARVLRDRAPQPVNKRREAISKWFETSRPKIQTLWQQYRQSTRLTGLCDRGAAEKAVASVYIANGLDVPAFVWFDSPQAAVVPILLCALFETMSLIADPLSAEKVLFPAELIRENIGKRRSLSTEFRLCVVGKREDVQDEIARLMWNRGDWPAFATDHHFEMRDVLMDRFCRKSRSTQPLNVWFTAWRQVRETLVAVDASSAELWERCGDILWSFSDQEQSLLIDTLTCHFDLGIAAARRGMGDTELVVMGEILEMMGLDLGPALPALGETLSTCGWWWAGASMCFMIDRPILVNYDENGNLHKSDGLALAYADNTGIYALRGITVAEDIVLGRFSADDIENQGNTELRRVMIERYGFDRYLKETGAQEVHRDECGVLYLKELFGDEPLAMVKVLNSTAEPDGSFKEYYLRVPPNMRSAREAIAWTFGMTEFEYKPNLET